jgi:hypothetical protein
MHTIMVIATIWMFVSTLFCLAAGRMFGAVATDVQ